jgi:hypothetical protein
MRGGEGCGIFLLTDGCSLRSDTEGGRRKQNDQSINYDDPMAVIGKAAALGWKTMQ